MSKQIAFKLKQILKEVPNNSIFTSKWLQQKKISTSLISKYKKSNWIKSIGTGAYTKLNDKYDIDSAIYALQNQLNLSIHIGGLSALSDKYSISQNVIFNSKTNLYGIKKENLPKWFKTVFKDKYNIFLTDFLPKNLGIENFDNNSFETKISSMERSILEILYLVPNVITTQTAYQTMEFLSALRPDLLQELLKETKSIKVKRLFLYMAEKINYPWFEKLNIKKINLGNGIRKIVAGGKFDKKYKIVIDNIEQ
ncbi:type IV toxin-antitoxin system AbiEi family antitoxin domain-containing protein [Candidatus Ruminimicrobium bovinum]|uniref:type IV toxin-antitoxin system AbiEi family antitoxin domain-containing protein n=1 Tax=Candidatus Ruminimicrobium bovinum TaxID=3242779 RepID=UPI0039B8B5F9